MRLSVLASVALLLGLAGCGGVAPSSESSAPTSTKTPTTRSTQDGDPVPGALSGFVCTRDDKGVWSASGAVTNESKTSRSFQVTVQIGPVGDGRTAARTTRLAAVQAKGSARFELVKIEAAGDDGPCHVRVLATN